MYRITFIAPQHEIEILKRKGRYPFEIGGVTFESGESTDVEDIKPFLADERFPTKNGKFVLDTRLTYEEINGDVSETEN